MRHEAETEPIRPLERTHVPGTLPGPPVRCRLLSTRRELYPHAGSEPQPGRRLGANLPVHPPLLNPPTPITGSIPGLPHEGPATRRFWLPNRQRFRRA
jgi:hypothetical protein